MPTDRQNAEYYEAPERRAAGGAARRRTRRADSKMTSHVAVRFPAELVEKVKLLATEDGQSVSGWIRTVVDGEVARRLPAQPATHAQASHLTVVSTSGWTAGFAISSSDSTHPEMAPAAVSK